MKKCIISVVFIVSTASTQAYYNYNDLEKTFHSSIATVKGSDFHWVAPRVLYGVQALSILHSYTSLEKKLSTYCSKIKQGTLRSFIQKEYSYTSNQPVEIYVGHGIYFGILDPFKLVFSVKNTIVITPEYYEILKPMFDKDESVWAEQERKTADMLRFLIQHAAYDVHHKTNLKNMLKSLCILGTQIGVFELLKTNLEHNHPWLAYIALGTIGGLISVYGQRREVHAADANIKTEAAIAGGKMLLHNIKRVHGIVPALQWRYKLNMAEPSIESRLDHLDSLRIIQRTKEMKSTGDKKWAVCVRTLQENVVHEFEKISDIASVDMLTDMGTEIATGMPVVLTETKEKAYVLKDALEQAGYQVEVIAANTQLENNPNILTCEMQMEIAQQLKNLLPAE